MWLRRGEAFFGAINTGLAVIGAQWTGLDANMVVVSTLALFVVEGFLCAEALILAEALISAEALILAEALISAEAPYLAEALALLGKVVPGYVDCISCHQVTVVIA